MNNWLAGFVWGLGGQKGEGGGGVTWCVGIYFFCLCVCLSSFLHVSVCMSA